MRSYSIAMIAACPFPVNYGSPAAIRELSATLSEMGHDIHIVTYPHGQDISVGKARLHRVAENRPAGSFSAGPSREKMYFDFLMLGDRHKTLRQEKFDIINSHNYQEPLIAIFGKFVTYKSH